MVQFWAFPKICLSGLKNATVNPSDIQSVGEVLKRGYRPLRCVTVKHHNDV